MLLKIILFAENSNGCHNSNDTSLHVLYANNFIQFDYENNDVQFMCVVNCFQQYYAVLTF